MKKFISMFIGMCFVLFAGSVFASGYLVPTVVNGNDVAVPGFAVDTVNVGAANYEVVAVMHDIRGAKHKIKMERDGEDWIAFGAKGQDFHPVVVVDGEATFILLEDAWEIGLYMEKRKSKVPFVVWRGPGKPCLHLE